jgi:large subunit ribosomal protein L17|tara:strand:- start:53 stop:586 length:534 start_codon:yes stop_codon:yes gene_type:complete
MRHGKKVMHLGRKTAHRKSMLSNMACSLIEHKRINTTVTKAKALKQFVEPIITKAKSDSTHNRRLVFSSLRDKETVTELFRDVATKVGDRPGGYTRIIKLGNRLGDNASMAMIELVDYNEVYKSEATEKKKTRRRGGKAKTTASETVIEVKEETAPVAEEAIPEIDTKNDEDTENAK